MSNRYQNKDRSLIPNNISNDARKLRDTMWDTRRDLYLINNTIYGVDSNTHAISQINRNLNHTTNGLIGLPMNLLGQSTFNYGGQRYRSEPLRGNGNLYINNRTKDIYASPDGRTSGRLKKVNNNGKIQLCAETNDGLVALPQGSADGAPYCKKGMISLDESGRVGIVSQRERRVRGQSVVETKFEPLAVDPSGYVKLDVLPAGAATLPPAGVQHAPRSNSTEYYPRTSSPSSVREGLSSARVPMTSGRASVSTFIYLVRDTQIAATQSFVDLASQKQIFTVDNSSSGEVMIKSDSLSSPAARYLIGLGVANSDGVINGETFSQLKATAKENKINPK